MLVGAAAKHRSTAPGRSGIVAPMRTGPAPDPRRRSASALWTLRRERLPLALLAGLALLLQILLQPLTVPTALAAITGDPLGTCLGLETPSAHALAGVGEAERGDGHGPAECPCGPLCLHALAAASLLPPPPDAAPLPAQPARTAGFRPVGADRVAAARSSGGPGIRAPPRARAAA